jgi:natural product precursor
MKTKSNKKLNLNKITISKLERNDLGNVNGGAVVITHWLSACPTCVNNTCYSMVAECFPAEN